MGREKVLEDDELENKDLDIKSEQIEEDAFEDNNLLAETLKQPLQRLGKGLVNGEYFVNASVEKFGSALPLESKQRLKNLFKDLERHQNGHSSQYPRSCPCPQRTMAECGPRVRKYRRFQVGAFMAVHKQKREEAFRQSEKTIAENLKIAEKVKELRAKKQKLERLETKVIYDCVIGMLRARHNS